tara:strand:- start:1050 stop:1226 length:177 start_codon:yes stop_codon:yes gene_type:complete
MKYTVTVKETHYAFYSVEADSKEQAKEFTKDRNDNAEFTQSEYSHENSSDEWDVEETE